MTIQELDEAMTRQDSRLRDGMLAIVAAARPLVAILHDSGHPTTAKEIERLLFLYDAEVQATGSLMKENVGVLLEAITGRRPPERGREQS